MNQTVMPNSKCKMCGHTRRDRVQREIITPRKTHGKIVDGLCGLCRDGNAAINLVLHRKLLKLASTVRRLKIYGGSGGTDAEAAVRRALIAAELEMLFVPRRQKIKVLVEVNRGMVSAVHASPVGVVDVAVCDHDCEPDKEDREPEFATWFTDGQTAHKFLEQVRINPEHYETLR